MKKILFILILLNIACSSNDNNSESNQDGVITLEVNNVYLKDPTVSSGTVCVPNGAINNDYSVSCWRDLTITDGTYTQSAFDNKFYADDNTTYRIIFLELQLVGDFSTQNTFEDLYDANNDLYSNQGTEGIHFVSNIVVQNGNHVSSNEVPEFSVGYVKFTLISENNFTFYFEMIDGTKYQGSFNGNVNILDEINTFIP